MGLFGAMTASVSGLSAQSESISVISDNLSNSNTVGFKSARTYFTQLVTSSGVGGTQFNAGGASSDVLRTQAAQGSFISTQNSTDLALSGGGFFMVTDSSDITTDTEYFYTRAGVFSENKEGFLTTPSGLYLQGWETDSDGQILNIQSPKSVELQSVGVSAQATSHVNLGVNLNSTIAHNASGIYNTATAVTVDRDAVAANPSLADHISDIRVYDSEGGARDVAIGYTKRSSNFWDYVVYADGADIQGGTAGTNVIIGEGTLRFDTNGSLKRVNEDTSRVDMSDILWSDGVTRGNITANFGDYTGGKYVSTTAGLGYTNDILDIAIEDDAFPTGTFDLNVSGIAGGVATVQLRDSVPAVVETATITAAAGTGIRELYFPISQVRITVSDDFNIAATGVVGNFTVANQVALDKGVGTDGVVQLASTNNNIFVNQNGFGSGTLAAIQVDEEGFISGTFTNGETKNLYKLSIAVFQNPSALEIVSQSLLRVTNDSGQPLLKEAGVGGTATVISGSLEQSTVDVANEFSQMIIAQRAFQASSTVISTADQMLNELMQLR